MRLFPLTFEVSDSTLNPKTSTHENPPGSESWTEDVILFNYELNVGRGVPVIMIKVYA
jgi:hypothetical protein